MRASELQAYANGALDGYNKGTDYNLYDPQTHAAERQMYQMGYDYGVALYCEELEQGEKMTGKNALANLEAILSDNGSEMTVSALDRSLYKYTDCGAHLSVQLHDGTWRHSGNLFGIENGNVRQLLVGSIVEGSDADVCADPIDLTAFDDPEEAVKVFKTTVDWVNDEACALWDEANDEDEDEDEDEEGESK